MWKVANVVTNFYKLQSNSLLILSNILFTTKIIEATMSGHNFYNVFPNKLGVKVTGINLEKVPSENVIQQIKKDVTKYKVMIFKDQGLISGDRQVAISEWFGELESTFYKHPRSPHPDIFRVSNDENEGCTGVGRTGWHIDGSFQPAPFAYSTYHIISVPTDGATVFAPLDEVISKLPKEQKEKWDRLWMASDRRTNRVHPLIYSHPITGDETLCLHLGMTDAFVWDYGTPQARMTDSEETEDILKEIHEEFVKDNKAIQYVHKWEEGDFIISDNLAVGHEAHPSTQLPRSKVGLRVMHRTTIKGVTLPRKIQKTSSHNDEL